MKKIIVLGIVLLPCLVHAAATNCKVVEYADHYELSCVGDEKYVPAPAQQAVTPTPAAMMPPAVTAPAADQQAVQTPSGGSADFASAPTMQAPGAAQTDAAQKPVVHRQGRPPQWMRDEAKAMRNRLIDERLQQQQQQ